MGLTKQQIKEKFAKKFLSLTKKTVEDGLFDDMLSTYSEVLDEQIDYLFDEKVQPSLTNNLTEDEGDIIFADTKFQQLLDKKVFEMLYQRYIKQYFN